MNTIDKLRKTYKKKQRKVLKRLNNNISKFINEFLPKYIANKIKNNFDVNKCIISKNSISFFDDYLNNDYAISYIIKKIRDKYGIVLEYDREFEKFEVTINTCTRINKKINKNLKKYNDNEKMIVSKIKDFIKNNICHYYLLKIDDNIFSSSIIISYKDLDINELVFKENIMFIRFYLQKKYKLKTYFMQDYQLQIELNI